MRRRKRGPYCSSSRCLDFFNPSASLKGSVSQNSSFVEPNGSLGGRNFHSTNELLCYIVKSREVAIHFVNIIRSVFVRQNLR